jgi:hypothetical protein
MMMMEACGEGTYVGCAVLEAAATSRATEETNAIVKKQTARRRR